MMLRTALFLGLVGLIVSSGCSQLLGNLRRDLRDEDDYSISSAPTVGGRWSERGFLNEDIASGAMYNDRYAAVGHSERAPASMAGRGAPDGNSWVSPDQDDLNRRDRYRSFGGEQQEGGAAYSNSPTVPPPTKRLYKNGSRATRADFVDESPNEGSLWASDGQTNYYFTKNKVRGIGDIVNIAIEDAMLKDILQESKRTLTPREKDLEIAAAQERLRGKSAGGDQAAGRDALATSAAAPEASPAGKGKGEEKDVPRATGADIDLAKSMEIKAGDMIMSEIVERYPNGNYKIRGTKRILYKKGPPRLLTVIGVARGVDISEDDTVSSGKLYEYRLEAIR